MAKSRAPKKGINSRAAINQIKIDSLPFHVFSGHSDILPFGIDNHYPHRIIEAVKKSPTALGCIKRQSEFIFGQGVKIGGDTIVNRDDETLDDIIWQCVRHGYSILGGFGLHFNFNALGQICEMFFVNQEYIRKHRTLRRVDYGIWRDSHGNFLEENHITIDIYGKVNPLDAIAKEGFSDYKGQIYYYAKDGEIYPTSPLDSAIISASYEREAQVYPFANIKNGFSGTSVIKYPTMAMGENAAAEADKIDEDLKQLHGSENAGGSLVISVPVGMSGEAKNFQMVESLTPPNIDGLFTNQNKKAEGDVLKVYNMPGELIGIPTAGAFSRDAYDEAFNMKNSDVEIDRQAIEREFNKILPLTTFAVDSIELEPMKMRGQGETPEKI